MPRLSLPLTVLLGLVLLLAFLGLGRKMTTPTLQGAVFQILQGSPDQEARLELVRHVRDRAAPHAEGDRTMAGFLATSAIVLGDRKALERAQAALGGPLLVRDSAELGLWLDELSLGEAPVRALLLGMAAEGEGDQAGARAHYSRAETGGRMWAMPLAVELARDRLARLP